jgi:hypothetical protein
MNAASVQSIKYDPRPDYVFDIRRFAHCRIGIRPWIDQQAKCFDHHEEGIVSDHVLGIAFNGILHIPVD